MTGQRASVIDDRDRQRRAALASCVVHAGVLAALMLHEPPPVSQGLTEITFLDLPELTAPPPPEVPVAEEVPPPEPIRIVAEPSAEEPAHFARETPEAPVAPRPQSVEKLRDDVRDRLMTAVAPSPKPRSTAVFSSVGGPERSSPRAAGVGSPSRSESVTLSRGARVVAGRRVSLDRGSSRTPSSSALAHLERVDAPEPARGREMAGASDSTVVLELAGASLVGPVADRAILDHPSPVYPEWAKRSAVEGSVTLYFVVLPDGTVRSNVLVQKTSGARDFDENAIAALRTWRFQTLPAGSTGDQWGNVTFNYRLRGMIDDAAGQGE